MLGKEAEKIAIPTRKNAFLLAVKDHQSHRSLGGFKGKKATIEKGDFKRRQSVQRVACGVFFDPDIAVFEGFGPAAAREWLPIAESDVAFERLPDLEVSVGAGVEEKQIDALYAREFVERFKKLSHEFAFIVVGERVKGRKQAKQVTCF